MNAHNQLKFNAVISILFGTFALIAIAVIYLKWGNSLCALILERHPDMYWFVLAFKLLVLVVCPSLSFVLIIIGWQILRFFKKELKEKV